MRVTSVGAGNMARGIGTRLVTGGHEVELIDHDPEDARALADELNAQASGAADASDDGAIAGGVVVLAVPYPSLSEALEQYGHQLGGKIVVDITNPIDLSTMDRLATPPGISATEEIARQVPDARVVKAFNTIFAGTLVAGRADGEPLDVLIAGDDGEAKKRVATPAKDGGLRPIDVGPLRRAKQLEYLGLLHVTMQDTLRTNYASAVKLIW
jgi:8-hydroxy-5-deazaflavin:NADPH oxidoreductase